jgi:hypothetical protein
MRIRASIIIVATLTALATLVAGCTSKSASNKSPAPGNAGGKTPSCDLAPASLVNSALGTHVGNAQAQDLHTIVVCRYSPVGGGTGNVVIRIQTDMSRATFDQARQLSDANHIPTTDLPGFQDTAYTSVLSAGTITTNTVVALKGTVEILVSSGASFDAEKALETQLFAKLA